MAKTKAVVSGPLVRSPAPVAAVVMCNGLAAKQVTTLKYLDLHFHTSGDMSQSRMLCRRTSFRLIMLATLQLRMFLLHHSPRACRLAFRGVIGLSLRYGCELWGMHSPCGAAKRAQTASQSIYERYLRRICRVKHSKCDVVLRCWTNWDCRLYRDCASADP